MTRLSPTALFITSLTGAVWLACCSGYAPVASPSVAGPAPVPVAEVAPVPVGVVASEWTYESTPGKVLTTAHYRIHTTVTRDALLDRMPKLMEAALSHYRSAVAPLPPPEEPLDTFVFGNRPQWERMTQRFMGEDAGVYLRIIRGGYTARGRSVLFDIGMRDTLAIAAHEGWHQYTQTVFRDQLPTAFEEGLATYMEGFRLTGENRDQYTFKPWANPERFFTLRRAAERERLMPLGRLVRSTPQELMAGDEGDALTYYAQVWALVHFLREGAGGAYKDSLARMVSDAVAGKLAFSGRRSGRRAPDLLEAYTGHTADDLEPAYSEFIRQVTRVGSGEKVMRGDSPLDP